MTESAEPVIRVVVADDQRAVRDALVTVLEVTPGFEVVGAAADGEEAVRLVLDTHPDVVLMDLRMPGTDGVAATGRIRAECPDVQVVVLTTFADDSSILAALDAGAVGFLTKDAGRQQIAMALRAAAGGQAVLDPAVQARLLAAARGSGLAAATGPDEGGEGAGPDQGGALPDGLTKREADVLRLIADGATNVEIARQLYIGEATVKTHINNLFAKAGVRSRAEAVTYAYRHGMAERRR